MSLSQARKCTLNKYRNYSIIEKSVSRLKATLHENYIIKENTNLIHGCQFRMKFLIKTQILALTVFSFPSAGYILEG